MPGNHLSRRRWHANRDGASPGPGEKLTYEIARRLVDIVLVSEDDIRQSMVALIQRNKVITERPGR